MTGTYARRLRFDALPVTFGQSVANVPTETIERDQHLQELEVLVVDLEAGLADVRDVLAVRLTESDAEVTVEELPRVVGDERQLRQVFQNRLKNAIAHSGDEPG